jgi:hypothetical protein
MKVKPQDPTPNGSLYCAAGVVFKVVRRKETVLKGDDRYAERIVPLLVGAAPRGLLAILFGVLAFAWPALTLTTLVLLFGTYVFVNGAFLIFNALGSRKEKED